MSLFSSLGTPCPWCEVGGLEVVERPYKVTWTYKKDGKTVPWVREGVTKHIVCSCGLDMTVPPNYDK